MPVMISFVVCNHLRFCIAAVCKQSFFVFLKKKGKKRKETASNNVELL